MSLRDELVQELRPFEHIQWDNDNEVLKEAKEYAQAVFKHLSDVLREKAKSLKYEIINGNRIIRTSYELGHNAVLESHPEYWSPSIEFKYGGPVCCKTMVSSNLLGKRTFRFCPTRYGDAMIKELERLAADDEVVLRVSYQLVFSEAGRTEWGSYPVCEKESRIDVTALVLIDAEVYL